MTLDDHDLKTLNVNWLRKNIGVVSQEPVLFDMTIAENIKFGAIHEATRQEVEEAARMANAHDFISKLPNVRLLFIYCEPKYFENEHNHSFSSYSPSSWNYRGPERTSHFIHSLCILNLSEPV